MFAEILLIDLHYPVLMVGILLMKKLLITI